MLINLCISNLAIVTTLDIEFSTGMNVLTGETGAGKSILIDALGLILGERASANIIRKNADKAEVVAAFDLAKLPKAKIWLQQENLNTNEEECIIRRIITREGRSRAYINSTMVAASQLKELGYLLLTIHAQHEHQNLLTSSYQRELLDQYANNQQLLEEVSRCYQQIQQIEKELELHSKLQDQSAEKELLEYHIKEIEELQIESNECSSIVAEHKKLAHSSEIQNIIDEADSILNCNTEYGISPQIQQLIVKINQLVPLQADTKNFAAMLQQIDILLSEASSELQQISNNININPEKLDYINSRLEKFHKIARKHQITIEQLENHNKKLQEKFNNIENKQNKIDELLLELDKAKQEYKQIAAKLTQSRIQAAEKLEIAIMQQLKLLAMPKAKLRIAVNNDVNSFTAAGQEQINFLVAPNPGLELGDLRKIVSGGELSRISLAIQVIASKTVRPPTLIFDEVDTGISGKTAEIVGQLLKTLAKKAQILCITHLPQVAALGDTHFRIEKIQNANTHTKIDKLEREQRIEELARLVAGIEITPEAKKLASVMLDNTGS